MVMKSFCVPLGTVDTDVIACPATQNGACVLMVGNLTAGALTFALKLYRQASGTATVLATGVSVPANSTLKVAAPIALEEGDVVRMSSSSANNLVASGTFTHGDFAPAVSGFVGRGVWSGAATYARNDVATRNGLPYLSLQDANISHDPATSPAYWMLFFDATSFNDDIADLEADVASLAGALAALPDLSLATGAGLVGIADTGSNYAGTTVEAALTEIAASLASLSANKQPLDSDLTAIAALTTTSYGRALLTMANADAARVSIGARMRHALSTTLADDTVATIAIGTAPKVTPIMLCGNTVGNPAGILKVRCAASLNGVAAITMAGGTFNYYTTALTGTTGADGAVNFGADTAGNFYIENRIGYSAAFYVWAFES
jgi:hypothetical protein